MSTSTTTRRPPRPVWRRSEAVGDVVVNALLLFLVNAWPGWRVVPFLTADFKLVLPLLNLSMTVALCFGLVRLMAHGWVVKGLRDLTTGLLGCAVMLRLWQVFPFDLGTGWTTVFRVVLALGILGTAIAVIVAAVTLVTHALPMLTSHRGGARL